MPFVIQERPEKSYPFKRPDWVREAKQMLVVAAIWCVAAIYALYVFLFTHPGGDQEQELERWAPLLIVAVSGIVIVPLAIAAAAFLTIRARRRRSRASSQPHVEDEHRLEPPRTVAGS